MKFVEQNIVGSVIGSFQWNELVADVSKQRVERLLRELTERLTEEILMQIHEWYLEEMSDVFPIEDLQKLKRRFVGPDDMRGDAGEVN